MISANRLDSDCATRSERWQSGGSCSQHISQCLSHHAVQQVKMFALFVLFVYIIHEIEKHPDLQNDR